MKPIKPIDIMLTGSLKGRDAPTYPKQSKHAPTANFSIDTPSLPFETEPLKIRRPNVPKRVQTAHTKSRPRTAAKNEYQYAMRFPDFTWSHTDIDQDKYANREKIIEVAENFDQVIRSINDSDEIETASTVQCAADLLLENIESQLRAECREQSELVSRVRQSYAYVFSLMEQDAEKARELIDKLKKGNEKLEENLTKIIDNATERVKEAQDDCARQIKNINKEMDDKKEEYDTSMKRFLEQKVQLEEHVKALHRVFLDFQNDSVYITLEDLKQKQESLLKKLRNKDQEITKLQAVIEKQKKQIEDESDQKLMLEQANDELRRKLKSAMANANRLQRRIDMQNIDGIGGEIFNDEDDEETGEDANKTESPASKKNKRNRRVDITPFLSVHQKLTKIGDKIIDVLQRTNSNSSMFMNDSGTNDFDKLMMSCDARLMMRALEQKIDEIARMSQHLDSIDGFAGLSINGSGSVYQSSNINLLNSQTKPINLSGPRFLQFIHTHMNQGEEAQTSENKTDQISSQNQTKNNTQEKPSTNQNANTKQETTNPKATTNQTNAQPATTEESPIESQPLFNVNKKVFGLMRKIFQAKYMSDQWRQRMGMPPMRFPEFVVSYYCQDKENMFTALQRCGRLWNMIQKHKVPEIKLFRKFLLEKFSVDELSFFLELRMNLIGLPPVVEDEDPIITVSFIKFKEAVKKVLGSFSPVSTTIIKQAEKLLNGKEDLDYAEFSLILINFYQGERRKRRNAIRLMFQSKRFAGSDGHIDFENFHAMCQSLGFRGSIEDIFELFRESTLIGQGELSIDSMLAAMDNLSFHFYTIEFPARLNNRSDLVALSKKDLLFHWQQFAVWFEGFKVQRENFDTWATSRVVAKINNVDKLFKSNAPVPSLFSEYRSLLDMFQFLLDVMAKGKTFKMGAHMAERELSIMENLVDLLVTFVADTSDSQVEFNEFE